MIRLLGKVIGYLLLGVSSLLQVAGMITQPDHLGDKLDESGVICRLIGHDVPFQDPTFRQRCRRCKRYVTVARRDH